MIKSSQLLLRCDYSKSQPPFFFCFLVCSAALVARSKTSLTPSFVRAEHSTYLQSKYLNCFCATMNGVHSVQSKFMTIMINVT